MSDDLKERIREIEESARKVDKLSGKLATKSLERKFAKEEWEAAVERHMELCRNWEDSEEVEDRPLIKAVESRDEDDTDAEEDAEADEDRKELVEPWDDVSDPEPEELEAMGIDPDEHSGLDLVTSHPGSDPESNGVEATKPRRRRKKAKA